MCSKLSTAPHTHIHRHTDADTHTHTRGSKGGDNCSITIHRSPLLLFPLFQHLSSRFYSPPFLHITRSSVSQEQAEQRGRPHTQARHSTVASLSPSALLSLLLFSASCPAVAFASSQSSTDAPFLPIVPDIHEIYALHSGTRSCGGPGAVIRLSSLHTFLRPCIKSEKQDLAHEALLQLHLGHEALLQLHLGRGPLTSKRVCDLCGTAQCCVYRSSGAVKRTKALAHTVPHDLAYTTRSYITTGCSKRKRAKERERRYGRVVGSSSHPPSCEPNSLSVVDSRPSFPQARQPRKAQQHKGLVHEDAIARESPGNRTRNQQRGSKTDRVGQPFLRPLAARDQPLRPLPAARQPETAHATARPSQRQGARENRQRLKGARGDVDDDTHSAASGHKAGLQAFVPLWPAPPLPCVATAGDVCHMRA